MGGISSTSPLQLESYQVIFDAATGISSNSVALTNLTNVTGPGVLSSIGINLNTIATGGWSAQLEVQIDGGPTRTLTIRVVGADGGIHPFASTLYDTSHPLAYLVPVNLRFAVSLRVGINVTVAAPGNTLSCTVCRGVTL